jgi:protein-tyrosine phosphatase
MKALFICTGNMCRSPAAEKMLRHAGGAGFEARSRGTAAQAYCKMPRQVTAFLEEMGITDISHAPAIVREEDINWADLVLVMENCHFEDLAERFPQSLHKMHLFLDYCTGGEGKELRDPMGKGDKAFDEVLTEIHGAIDKLVKKAAGSKAP